MRTFKTPALQLSFLLPVCLLSLSISACDVEPGVSTTDTQSDFTVPDTSDGEATDTVEEVVDECGGCGGVTACVAGVCVYDPAVVDVCVPACRGDIEKCVAGECVRLASRPCYLDSHCTTVGETCIGADPKTATPGACTYTTAPTSVCPGGDGCASATTALMAGAAKRAITTACGDCGVGFELPNTDYLTDSIWIGSLWDPATYLDCGRDQLCPGDANYPGPDSGEDDGQFQGYWIAGFDHSRPALGVRDELWARAVALRKGDTTLVIIGEDLVGQHYHDAKVAMDRITAELDVDLVITSATHTHEGADVVGQWGPGDIDGDLPAATGRDPEHLAFIQEQLFEVAAEAVANLKEAKVSVGQTRTGIEGLVHDSRDPVIINDEMVVVHLTSVADDSTIATLVNWHSHPESLWSENQYVSSDFPHFVREGLEQGLAEATDNTLAPAVTYPARTGLGGVAIYFSGTVGGLLGPGNLVAHDRDGTDYSVRGDYARTRAMGEVLAEHAFQALDSAEVLTDPALTFASTEFLGRTDNVQFHTAMFGLQLFGRPIYNFDGAQSVDQNNVPYVLSRMSIVTLGDITFYTLPGEGFSETVVGGYDGSYSFGNAIVENPEAPFAPDLSLAPPGPFMNERVPGRYAFVLGLGHDELGYLVPSYNYVLDSVAPYINEAPGDHYEETNGIGPTIEPQVNALLDALIAALP